MASKEGDHFQYFEQGQVNEIRALTAVLGKTVELVAPDIWSQNLQAPGLGGVVDRIVGKLGALIGQERLRPAQLSVAYQQVIEEKREEVGIIFEAVESVCEECQAQVPGASFQEGRHLIVLPGYPYKRYWLDAALMIAKELFAPLVELPKDCSMAEAGLIKKGVVVGNNEVTFDALLMPWSPGMTESTFNFIQKNEHPWEIMEMKAVFAWWRNVGKDPLKDAPREHVRNLNEQLDRAYDWWLNRGEEVCYPIHAANLFCFRGRQQSRLFRREWWQKRDDWALYEHYAWSLYPDFDEEQYI